MRALARQRRARQTLGANEGKQRREREREKEGLFGQP